MKKILLVIFLGLIMTGLTAAAVWILWPGKNFPPGTEEAIGEALHAPLPDLITGDTGHVVSSGIGIWYESLSPAGPSRGTILLFTGIASDALGVPDAFVKTFVDSGFRLVRFDYRGTGESDWMAGWSPERPYNLRDLAADALVILDTLHIGKAHLVGISMGGMVAQEFAINFPGRTCSMALLMTSGYIGDPSLPPLSKKVGIDLMRNAVRYSIRRTETNAIKLFLSGRLLLMGPSDGPLDLRKFAEGVLYDLRVRRGFNLKASVQHMEATTASGSRYPELALLRLPVLVIHGTADPLIPIAHGRKCAQVIPGADTLWVSGMGHDIPVKYIDLLTSRIIGFFEHCSTPSRAM